MATKGKQQGQGPPPKPQFFRMLLPGFSQRMTIPQTFTKYIVGEIQEKATLVSPLGKLWPVGVHRATNFFYFGEGWLEFSQAHGLNVGCCLVFRYEGEMVFTVTVFDQTTCMKEYGPAGGGNKMDDNFSSHVELNPSESPRQQMCLQSMDSQSHNVTLASTCTDVSQFEINMSSYNPPEKPNLPLPQELVRYVSEDNSRLATILSPIGQRWHVKVHQDSKGFHFADGWQSRCETEHNLDVVSGVANGGIPTEEENSEKGLEKTSAFLFGRRVAEATKPTTGKHPSVKREKVVAQNQKSEAPHVVSRSARRPHFEVVINLSKPYWRYSLGLPSDFIASNGLSRANWWFLRDPNGQLWPIRLKHTSHSSRIRAGWRDFCVANNLKDGDVCLFEPKKKNELHVKIRRKGCLKSMKVLKDTSEKPKRFLCGPTAAESVKSELYHRARPSARVNLDQKVTEIPGSQFTSIISENNLFGNACLWPVSVYHWEAKMKHFVRIGCGWKAFCTGNNVELGDKCIFKPASRAKNDVFHVSIIKHKAAACPPMPGH